jgi:hypothetical protein
MMGESMAGDMKEPGMVASWYRDLQELKAGPHRPLPHVGIGAMIVTFFVGGFFVLSAADAITIIAAYGPETFFREGLRVTDWKHGVLSNGASLSFLWRLIRIPAALALMGVLFYATDFGAMSIRVLVGRTTRWVGVFLRLLGAGGLLMFPRWIYRQDYSFNNPLPLVALIAAVVLIWTSIASATRSDALRTGARHRKATQPANHG